MTPPIVLIDLSDVQIYVIAQGLGCTAQIVRDSSQLIADNESWTIGEKELPNCTEWIDETPKDLGTHTVISGGEVLELGPHKTSSDDLPF